LPAARRPLLLVGRQPLGCRGARSVAHFRERSALPVGCAFRSQHLFDNRHPNYAGDVGIGINPKLAARVREADVLLVIGERLGEITTSGYALLEVPEPAQKLIHVHPGSDELGRVYQPALPIAATPGAFLACDESGAADRCERMGRRGRASARGVHGVASAAARSRFARHVANREMAR
jgi:acetolactate synthase-1/2/3 large subunit